MAALRSSKPSTYSSSPFMKLSGETSNVPTNNSAVGVPSRRLTQEDQNKADKAKEQEATQNLVQTWLERLQLISVITTFFASTESGMLGKTLPSSNEVLSTAGQITNVCFMCALVVHVHASVISFLGAFFLIRYKLQVAEYDEGKAEEEDVVGSPTSISSQDPGKSSSPTTPYANELGATDPIRGRVRVLSEPPEMPIIWSTNPHLVQVGPFNRGPPTVLLSRCHSLCVFLTFIGFVFAIMGLISYGWDRLPQSIGISATVSMSVCIIAGVLILVVPSTKTSHIFYDRKSR